MTRIQESAVARSTSRSDNPVNPVSIFVKLLLIDGHYYVYRSYFAILHLSNSRGEPTNAIFGFTKTLRLMLKHLQPDLGAVVWDRGLPQRRTELQPGYKETRKEMPAPMVPQLDIIQQLTPWLGFKSLSLPDTEADDLMGCYAVKARERGIDVVLATNDKDLYPTRQFERENLQHGQSRSRLAQGRLRLVRRRRSDRKMGRAAGVDRRCARHRR